MKMSLMDPATGDRRLAEHSRRRKIASSQMDFGAELVGTERVVGDSF
jgi:hypothetical protein